MNKLFLCGCQSCGERWDEYKSSFKEPAASCPACGSGFTRTIPYFGNAPREFRPYDALCRPIPDSTKVKSFGNDRRLKPGKG